MKKSKTKAPELPKTHIPAQHVVKKLTSQAALSLKKLWTK